MTTRSAPSRRTARARAVALPALLVLAMGLAACGSGDDGDSDGMTIISDADGIVGQGDGGSQDAGAGADDDDADDADTTPDAGDDAVDPGTSDGPSGTVTLDGVDVEMTRIERCVPSDQMEQRIEGISGIDSLETLNLVSMADRGMFEMYYYSDSNDVRALTLRWSEEDDVLEATFGKVGDDADWIDGEGGTPDGEPLQVSDGTAVGGATVDGRELRFSLPIPAEPSC